MRTASDKGFRMLAVPKLDLYLPVRPTWDTGGGLSHGLPTHVCSEDEGRGGTT